MSRNRNRDRDRERSASSRPSVLDEARNELFSHIHRCGVMQATDEQQVEWMKETVEFLHERYPALNEKNLEQLQEIGIRFCRPVISRAPVVEAEAEAESAAA